MIGKGATPSFFAIANYNYTLTGEVNCLGIRKGKPRISSGFPFYGRLYFFRKINHGQL